MDPGLRDDIRAAEDVGGWIPAFAGMTKQGAGMTKQGAGMTKQGAWDYETAGAGLAKQQGPG